MGKAIGGKKTRGAAEMKQSTTTGTSYHSSSTSTNTPTDCAKCSRTVNDSDASIECDLCCQWYHAVCTELKPETFDVLVIIAAEIGWVCKDCRILSRQLRSFQATQAKFADELAALAASNAALTTRVAALEDARRSSPASSVAQNVDQLRSSLKSDVVAAVRDHERRRCNIIVSGLPPDPTIEDHDLFESFCVDNLGCKPLLVVEKCRRIDKQQPDRVPRLLVSFVNQSTRDDILKNGRNLRSSTNPVVRSVYFNPDLSRAEAKEAYDRRVRRRAGLDATPQLATADFPPLVPAAASLASSP